MQIKSIISATMVALLSISITVFAGSTVNESVGVRQLGIEQNSPIIFPIGNRWVDAITVGGLASAVAIASDHNWPMGGFTKYGSGTDLYVNNVNLLFRAQFTNWIRTALSLGYDGHPTYGFATVDDSTGLITFHPERHIDNTLHIDEAYVTFADYCKPGFFVTIGKKFLPFSDYQDRFIPIEIMSPAQRMGTFNETALIVGAYDKYGLFVDVFFYRGKVRDYDDTFKGKINHYGGTFGYRHTFLSEELPVNLNFGYMSDMQQGFYNYQDWPYGRGKIQNRHPVTGISLHGDIAFRQWDFAANYVAAWVKVLQNADPEYPIYLGLTNTRLWSYDLSLGYTFNLFGDVSRLGLSYQRTGHSVWVTEAPIIQRYIAGSEIGYLFLMFPLDRVVLDYKINLLKNVDLDFAVAHSRSNTYRYFDERSGNVFTNGDRNVNVGLVRLMVRF